MPTKLHNWGRTHHSDPSVVHQPRSEAEVAAVVQDARTAGQRVKVFGALHSWSSIAMPDQQGLSLDGMQRVLDIQPTAVRVQAGMRLEQLNVALDAAGLALPILGSVAQQSVAGAISTGTHGSSLQHGNLAAGVLGLRLVTGTGAILELDAQDPRLDAARVGLGALGIVTEVTLAVQPAFRLVEATTPLPLQEALVQLESLAASAEYVKLWWLPDTGMAMVFAADRTQEPSAFSPRARWIDERVVNRWLFAAVLGLGGVTSMAIPTLNRLVGKTYFRPRRQVAESHRIFNIAMPPVHREMEYAIPLEAASQALTELAAWMERDRIRVNFVLEVRFVRGDTAWMSPASGRDTCQIGAYIGQSRDVRRYYQGFEERMLAVDGRPHWGKEFFASGEEVLARYPKAAAFKALAAELDPDGVFRNPFLDHLLVVG